MARVNENENEKYKKKKANNASWKMVNSKEKIVLKLL